MSTRSRDRMSPAAGYRLWAPTYGEETVVSALEDRIVRELRPSVDGRRLLDVGCGVGRRMKAAADAPTLAVGLDLVPEMLLASRSGATRMLVAGDVRKLPFADGSFDLLWCRLVLGHVQELTAPYLELARVSSSDATLIVSDFHPAAVAAGHSRSFRDAAGGLHEIEHHAHEASHHMSVANSTGWTLADRVDAPAGENERDFYARAGRLRQLEEERDLPLVLVMCFRR